MVSAVFTAVSHHGESSVSIPNGFDHKDTRTVTNDRITSSTNRSRRNEGIGPRKVPKGEWKSACKEVRRLESQQEVE